MVQHEARPQLSPEEEQGLALRMRELDRIHDRLIANDPESCAKAVADRERRLAAIVGQLERDAA